MKPAHPVTRYRMLKTEKERDVFNKDNPDWINGEVMKEYAETKRRTEDENQSNRQFLKECLTWLKNDSPRSLRIQKVLSQH